MTNNTKEILFSRQIQKSNDLTIDDLNRYLPALRKIDDFTFENHRTNEGVFYGLSLNGLEKISENSIDLIITEPPDFPIMEANNAGNNLTISEYLNWNQDWINESYRILKDTGSIYIICDWKLSGMYQSILNQKFNIQTRISWKSESKEKSKIPYGLTNCVIFGLLQNQIIIFLIILTMSKEQIFGTILFNSDQTI